MKKINKNEPQFFKDYLKTNKPKTWGELSRDISFDVRKYMLSGMTPDNNEYISEQNYQCAYTEIDIEPEESHVDHFKKQSMFQKHEFIFDWSNLFTASNNEDYGAKHKDKNININDYEYLINPALENPNKYLTYTLLGDVVEKSHDKNSIEYLKAKKTIDLFNLNDYALVEQRKTVSRQIKKMYEQLSLDEIKRNIGRFDTFVEFAYKAYKQMG